MLDLYKNIKFRREELGMSQAELAKRVGYTSRSTIARIERGDFDLSQSKIMEIAKALNVSPGELMGLDGIDAEFIPEPPSPEMSELIESLKDREDIKNFVEVAIHAEPADVDRMTDFLKRMTYYYIALKGDTKDD